MSILQRRFDAALHRTGAHALERIVSSIHAGPGQRVVEQLAGRQLELHARGGEAGALARTPDPRWRPSAGGDRSVVEQRSDAPRTEVLAVGRGGVRMGAQEVDALPHDQELAHAPFVAPQCPGAQRSTAVLPAGGERVTDPPQRIRVAFSDRSGRKPAPFGLGQRREVTRALRETIETVDDLPGTHARPSCPCRHAKAARSSTLEFSETSLIGYALVKRTLQRALATLTLLAGMTAVAAQGVDLLTGWADETELCAFTPATAVELFGIPSRAYAEDDQAVIEYSHRGFVLRFPGDDVVAPLDTITVYPVDRDGFMGFRGHFLGTVASGTAREPVERILRSVRAEIVSDEPDVIVARRKTFDLHIAFLYGVIDTVELACELEDEPAR